jgi:phosphopantetheine adenylyltransferase
MFAGEDTAAGRVTTFTIGITVAGIVAATSDDLTKTKEPGATFSSEIENVVINIAELYKESLDNDAVIVTIPDCNNVTVFSLITALVKSEELYVHTPVLLLGLVGSTIENDGFVNDLFVISSAPT